jgi:uncharacterized membrane protein
MMNKNTLYITFTALVLGLIAVLACKEVKAIDKPIKLGDDSQKKALAGTIQGGSMLIGSALLMGIVMIGLVVALIIYATAKTGKAIAKDPDVTLDRVDKAAGIYAKAKGRGGYYN